MCSLSLECVLLVLAESCTLQRLHKDFLAWQQHMEVCSASQSDADAQGGSEAELGGAWEMGGGGNAQGDTEGEKEDWGRSNGGRDWILTATQAPDYLKCMELMRPHTAGEGSLSTVPEMAGSQGTGWAGGAGRGEGGKGGRESIGRASRTRRALMAAASRSSAKHAAGFQV